VACFLKEHEGKFSIDIDGVTSVSLDHHKFALAPKGVAALFFKTKELRQSMYFIYTDWVGGIYATPSFPGSRSGFASAGAWYALTHVGKKQYVENSMRIVEATKTAAKDLAKIDGVRVMGNPELCVLAFLIDLVDCYSVSSYLMKEKGWKISALHIPKGLHVSVTLANCGNVKNKLASDVK
jgi:glutamate/tyrosine decarboxylase-like PLP-dependent enzyme